MSDEKAADKKAAITEVQAKLATSRKEEDTLQTYIQKLEKQIEQLKHDNNHLHARIRGYLTLSQILVDAKRELNHHKQQNFDLQRKLSSFNNDGNITSHTANATEHSEQNNSKNVKEEASHGTVTVHLETNKVPNTRHIGVQTDFQMLPDVPGQSPQSSPDIYSKNPTSYKQSSAPSSTLGPSFVVLSPSHLYSLHNTSVSDVSSISEQSELSSTSLDACFPSNSSSLRLQSLPSSLQNVSFMEEKDEISDQLNLISQTLQQIVNISEHSRLATELAGLSEKLLWVQKQIKLKEVIKDNLLVEYNRLKTQINILLPDIEKQNNLLRQENQQLKQRINQLEVSQNEDQLNADLQANDEPLNLNKISQPPNHTPQDDVAAHEDNQCKSCHERLENKVKRLEIKNIELMNVNDKWNKHCMTLTLTHTKEVDELRRRNYDLCSSLEKTKKKKVPTATLR